MIDLTGTSQRVIIRGLVLNCNSVSKSAVRNLTAGGNGLTHTSAIRDLFILENTGYAIDIENPADIEISNIQSYAVNGKGGLLRILQSSSTINYGELEARNIKIKSDLSSANVNAGVELKVTAGTLNQVKMSRVGVDAYPNTGSKPCLLIDGAVKFNSFDNLMLEPGDNGKPSLKIINGAESNHFTNVYCVGSSNYIIIDSASKNNMFEKLRCLDTIFEDDTNGLNFIDEWGWGMQPFPDGCIPFSINQKELTRGQITQNYGYTQYYWLSDVPYYPFLAVELRAYVSANTLSGLTILTVRKNASNTAKALSIAAGATGFFKERNVAVDYNRWGLNSDKIDLRIDTFGSTGSITLIPVVVIIPRKTLNTG
jgi:hypothetical protein